MRFYPCYMYKKNMAIFIRVHTQVLAIFLSLNLCFEWKRVLFQSIGSWQRIRRPAVWCLPSRSRICSGLRIHDFRLVADDCQWPKSSDTTSGQKLIVKHLRKYFDFWSFDLHLWYLLFGVREYNPNQIDNELHLRYKIIFQIKTYMQMLLRGMAYLHQNNIMHRDLKPANLLIRSDFPWIYPHKTPTLKLILYLM